MKWIRHTFKLRKLTAKRKPHYITIGTNFFNNPCPLATLNNYIVDNGNVYSKYTNKAGREGVIPRITFLEISIDLLSLIRTKFESQGGRDERPDAYPVNHGIACRACRPATLCTPVNHSIACRTCRPPPPHTHEPESIYFWIIGFPGGKAKPGEWGLLCIYRLPAFYPPIPLIFFNKTIYHF